MADLTDGVPIGRGRVIPYRELRVRATKAGGPGGQHVNTASTRVEVTWPALTSPVLTEAERGRLAQALAGRLDDRGVLRVVSAETRSQSDNRARALARLGELVRRALAVPKTRRPTTPTRGSVERRLDAKKRGAARKRDRRWRGEDE